MNNGAGRGRGAKIKVQSSKLKGNSKAQDRKSTRLNSSHLVISYAVFCLKKKDREGVAVIIVPRERESAINAVGDHLQRRIRPVSRKPCCVLSTTQIRHAPALTIAQ